MDIHVRCKIKQIFGCCVYAKVIRLYLLVDLYKKVFEHKIKTKLMRMIEMIYKLKDNAKDSLQIAMDNFRDWLNSKTDNGDRYLKITIFFLHNAVELYLKSILIQIDETCIYSEDKQKLHRLCLAAEKSGLSLDEYLLKENVHTKSYRTLVELYKQNEILSHRVENALNKLAEYRNRFAHFGVNFSESWLELTATLYEIYRWILYDIYDDLKRMDQFYSYDDVIDTYEPWMEAVEEYFRKAVCYDSKYNVASAIDMMKNVVVSPKFRRFLEAYEILFLDESNYQVNEIMYSYKKNDEIIELHNKYDFFCNYTVIYSDCDGQYSFIFLIMHTEEKICLYNADCKIENFEDECDSIHEGIIRNGRKVKPLTENNIRNGLCDRLKTYWNQD